MVSLWLCAFCAVPVEAQVEVRTEGLVLDVVAAQQLAAPRLTRDDKELPLFPAVQKQDSRWLYRVKSYLPLGSCRLVLQFQTGEELQQVDLKVPAFCFKAPVPCEPARPIRDLGLAIINRYRAERGLKPIVYDPECATVSRINNERGGVHSYTVGLLQTWASPSDAEAAVRMWMTSHYNTHGVMLMNPSVTRGGTHSHPSAGTTWSGR